MGDRATCKKPILQNESAQGTQKLLRADGASSNAIRMKSPEAIIVDLKRDSKFRDESNPMVTLFYERLARAIGNSTIEYGEVPVTYKRVLLDHMREMRLTGHFYRVVYGKFDDFISAMDIPKSAKINIRSLKITSEIDELRKNGSLQA